jgi:ribosomal protein S18 acetylase RimI-like enzyme
MGYREASEADIEAVAKLHADSWRRNYRGAYSDSFLDGDVVADRMAVWTERLKRPLPNQYTIVNELDAGVVGFVHTILDEDPTWGALIDNLHVRHDLKGQGIGTRLMTETASVALRRRPSKGLYLWVLEQNIAAQGFYAALGGTFVESKMGGPFPGGGGAVALRCSWSDPALLVKVADE